MSLLSSAADWAPAKPVEISTPTFRIVAQPQTQTPHAAAAHAHKHKHHVQHTQIKQEHDAPNGMPAAAAASPSGSGASLSSPAPPPPAVVSSRGRIIKLKLHADDAGTSGTWTNVAIPQPPDSGATGVDSAQHTHHPPPPAAASAAASSLPLSKSRDSRKRKAEPVLSDVTGLASGGVWSDPSLEVEDMSDHGMLLRHSRSLHQLKREYVLTCFPAQDHQLLTEEGFVTLEQVQAHLARHGSMRVACPVDGRLEYHSIGAADLTVHTGMHRHVRMEGRAKAASQGGNQVSLLPTDNHRMFVRLSDGQRTAQPELPASVSPFSIHTAAAVYKAGQLDTTTVVQFTGMCELGAVVDDTPLPFVAPLELHTEERFDAFLQLFGLWLACDGEVDHEAVAFATNAPHVAAHLNRLCSRLDVTVVERTTTGAQRQQFRITSPRWRDAFATLGSRQRLGAWVWHQLDRRQLRLLIDGLRLVQINEVDTSNGGSLFTPCALFREQLQRLCFHAGYSACFEAAPCGWHVVYSSAECVALPQLHVASECALEDREGTVWCVSVPTDEQLIVFRRVLTTDASGTVTAASCPLLVGNTLKRHRLKRSVSTPRTPSLTATPRTPRGGTRPSKLSHSASMSQLSNPPLLPLSPTHTSSSANISPQQSPISHASGVMSGASALDWPGGSGSAHPSPLPSPPMSRQTSLDCLSLAPNASSQSLPQIDEDVPMQPVDSSAPTSASASAPASGGPVFSPSSSLEVKIEGGLMHTHPNSSIGSSSSSVSAKLESSPSSSTHATAGSTVEEKDPCPSPSSSPNDPSGGLDPFASWSDVSSSVLPLPTSWSLQSAGIDPSSMYYLKAWQAQAHLTNAPVAQPKFNYDSTARPWRLPKKYILCLTPPLANHAAQLAQMHANNANIITLPAAAFLQAASAPAVKSEANEGGSSAAVPPPPPVKRSHSRKEPLEGGEAKKSKKSHAAASQAGAAGGKGAPKSSMSAASSKAHAALDQELQEKQKLLAYLQVRCQLLRVREAKGLPPNPDAPTPVPETKKEKKESAAAAAAATAAAAAATTAAVVSSSASSSTTAAASSTSPGSTVAAGVTPPTATVATPAPAGAAAAGTVAPAPVSVRRHHTRDKKKLTEAGAALAADNATPKPAPTPRVPRAARTPAAGSRAAIAAEKAAAAVAAAAAATAAATAVASGTAGSTSTTSTTSIGIGLPPSSRASTPPNPAAGGNILLPSSSSSSSSASTLLSGLAAPIVSPSGILPLPMSATTTGVGVTSNGVLPFAPTPLLPLTLPPLTPSISQPVGSSLHATSSGLSTSLGASSSSNSSSSSSSSGTSNAIGSSGTTSTLTLDTSTAPLFPLGGLGMAPFQYDAAQLSQLAGIDVNTMVLLAQAQFQLSLAHPTLFGFGGLMPGLMGNFPLNTNLGAFGASSSLMSNSVSASSSSSSSGGANAGGLMLFGTGGAINTMTTGAFDLKAFNTGSSPSFSTAAAASSSSSSSSSSAASFSSFSSSSFSSSGSSSSSSSSTSAPLAYNSSSGSGSSSNNNSSGSRTGSGQTNSNDGSSKSGGV